MKWFRTNWQLFALVGGLTLFAGLTLGGPRRRNRPVAPNHPFTTPTETNGEDAMSPSTNTYGTVQTADQASFERLVLNAEGTVLVDFYADWCHPCRMIGPVLDELAREHPTVRIVKVNVDDSRQLVARYGVNSIPSLKVFEQGEIVAEHVGLADKARLEALLDI